MNHEIALSIVKKFLVVMFEKMNKAPFWACECKCYINDDNTFQEICKQDFEDDIDKCIDIFFRKIIKIMNNYTAWVYEMGYEGDLQEIILIYQTLDRYINECSLEELKDVLGLNYELK